MKKLMFILILSVPSLALKAQSVAGVNPYSDGFSKGYKKGFCFGAEPGTCIAPIPPIPPLPSNLESPDSYQDGYNEGFSQGLADQKKDISNRNQGYQTNSPESIDFIYKLNVGSMLEIAAAQKRLKGIALEKLNDKDYNTCIALCSKLLPSDPYDGELYALLGTAYLLGEKNYNKTLYYFRKGRQYDPTAMDFDRAIRSVEIESNNSKN
ncbi:MAG TPA: hypothetical protein VFE53_26310 [Mucilaginibacter sp.]|jgi:hypothetical protein|nr:hypothetical protein [Mucilaginibacter sp.]